ncbi:MAG TPA: cupin domain-containing protein [Caulobacteraceae bacterium]
MRLANRLSPLWAAVLAAPLIAHAAVAQPPVGIHKTTLQEIAFPAPLHTLTVRTLVDPGVEVAPHTHSGVEMGYVVSGTAQVTVRGAAPKQIGRDGSFVIPPGAVHWVKNVGPRRLTIVSTFIVDPTKPIASPAAGAAPATR